MKRIKSISAAMLLVLSAVSCISPKKVLYLQDMGQDSQIQLENKYEARISANDELRIIITCDNEELSRPFNLNYGGNGGMGSMMGGSGNYMGYLVDIYGNIQMPILGELHVAGKTRLQLQDEIRHMLVAGEYIENPFVMVRFNNYKVFFLGPDGGKAITIPEERCTFLEALALSGDLSNFTRRDRIAVLREVDGKMTMRYLDPRNSDVFNDPYYMLQQNDIVITQAIRSAYYREELSYWTSWIAVLTSLTSITTLIAFIKNQK